MAVGGKCGIVGLGDGLTSESLPLRLLSPSVRINFMKLTDYDYEDDAILGLVSGICLPSGVGGYLTFCLVLILHICMYKMYLYLYIHLSNYPVEWRHTTFIIRPFIRRKLGE